MVEKVCVVCSSVFDTERDRATCSSECRYSLASTKAKLVINTLRFERDCALCGGTFSSKGGGNIYCSRDCARTAKLNRRYNRDDRECAECGVKFPISPCGAKTCSSACQKKRDVRLAREMYHKHKQLKEPEVRRCAVCGSDYSTSNRSWLAKTCSPHCQKEWARLGRLRRGPASRRRNHDSRLEEQRSRRGKYALLRSSILAKDIEI